MTLIHLGFYPTGTPCRTPRPPPVPVNPGVDREYYSDRKSGKGLDSLSLQPPRSLQTLTARNQFFPTVGPSKFLESEVVNCAPQGETKGPPSFRCRVTLGLK